MKRVRVVGLNVSFRDASKSTAQELSRTIAKQAKLIEKRWLERVQKDVVKSPGIELTQLRAGLPDYLHALVELLSEGDLPSIEESAGSAWVRVAREHGVTRVRLGFDIVQLVHEFIVLRHIIRGVVGEAGAPVDTPEALLADALDAAVAAAVEAYVEARDYETRRREAEHIGFLTHELRNPLSTAMLVADRLKASATPEQRRLFELLERSHRTLKRLIDSVLQAERLEVAERCERRRVRLGAVMERAIEGAREMAARKGLDFSADYDPQLPLQIDPGLTVSAVQNLADNAVKYTDAGRVEIVVDDRERDIVIHVRDRCGGLSEQELDTLFEPFQRGRHGKTGTGLGLPIARRAVETQGGSIGATSQSEGCHFWITLPKRGGET